MSLPPQPSSEDFDAIEAAVMETARGRWFLSEYARRNRAADTCTVLDAVAKLEKTLSTTAPATDATFSDQANAIVEKLRSDLRSLPLHTIATATEQATKEMLAVAEDIQETAWALRELGANPDFCEKLDRNAAAIHKACILQNNNGQYVAKIVQAMSFLEEHTDTVPEQAEPLPEKENVLLLHDFTLADDILGQDAVYDIFNSVQSSDTPALIEEVHVIAPQQYNRRAEQKAVASSTLIEAQSSTLPTSSLPQLQAALASEWATPDEEEAPAKNDSSGPANFQLSNYSFEEKLALFS